MTTTIVRILAKRLNNNSNANVALKLLYPRAVTTATIHDDAQSTMDGTMQALLEASVLNECTLKKILKGQLSINSNIIALLLL